MDKNIRTHRRRLTMRRIVKNLLNDLGFFNTVRPTTATGAGGPAQGPFDPVITDWNMPGPASTWAIRADIALSKVPVLMVTAEASDRSSRPRRPA